MLGIIINTTCKPTENGHQREQGGLLSLQIISNTIKGIQDIKLELLCALSIELYDQGMRELDLTVVK